MTVRTNQVTVTFQKPFVVGGFDEVFPAGDYKVETDEELIHGISFPVYRRISTIIYLPAKSGNPLLARALSIAPQELDAVLIRDRETR